MADPENVDHLDSLDRHDRHDRHALGPVPHDLLHRADLGDDLGGGHRPLAYHGCDESQRHDHGRLETDPVSCGGLQILYIATKWQYKPNLAKDIYVPSSFPEYPPRRPPLPPCSPSAPPRDPLGATSGAFRLPERASGFSATLGAGSGSLSESSSGSLPNALVRKCGGLPWLGMLPSNS